MKHNRKIIYLAGFLFSIPVALTSYINSSFLENYIDKSYVGLVYVLASLITILGLFKIPKIVSHIGNRISTLLFTFLIFSSLLFLAISKNTAVILLSFVVYFISVNLITACLDIFIEDFSKNSPVGSLRGFYLTIINLAWIFSQFISGTIISKSSFFGIYFFSAFIIFLFFLIFIFYFRKFKDPVYKNLSFFKLIKIFAENKQISKIYLINLIVKFFFAWMVIYTPIFLHENIGFDWDKIGIIFSIMLLPFVLLDFPLGKLSDKIGEKKILIFGFLIITISVLFIPYVHSPLVPLWALILFMTRVGAASIEIMSESYFFKVINKEESPDEISFFRNTMPVSYVIAPLFAVPILIYVPSFEYLFIILSAILLVGVLITLRIKDVK